MFSFTWVDFKILQFVTDLSIHVRNFGEFNRFVQPSYAWFSASFCWYPALKWLHPALCDVFKLLLTDMFSVYIEFIYHREWWHIECTGVMKPHLWKKPCNTHGLLSYTWITFKKYFLYEFKNKIGSWKHLRVHPIGFAVDCCQFCCSSHPIVNFRCPLNNFQLSD